MTALPVSASLAAVITAMATPTQQPAPSTPPQPADSDHYCTACDVSWWGGEPCWGCGGAGISSAALTRDDRVTWTWANQYRPRTITEGDPL